MTIKISARFVILVIFAIVAILFFWNWLNRYIYKPKADVDRLNITMTQSVREIKVGEENSLEIFLQPVGDTGISGVDLILNAENIKILDIGEPTAISPTDTAVFNKIIGNVSANGDEGRMAAVLVESDAKLPKGVKIQVLYEGLAEGPCAITINTDRSEVVGNISSTTYEFGEIKGGNLVCGDGGIPAGPAVSLRFEPTQTEKAVGDSFSYKFSFMPQAAGQRISAFNLKLGFDPSLVEALAVSDPVDTGERAPLEPTNPPTPIQSGPTGGPVTVTPAPIWTPTPTAASGPTPPPAGGPTVGKAGTPTPTGPAPTPTEGDAKKCNQDLDCPQPCIVPVDPITGKSNCLINKCVNNVCQMSAFAAREALSKVNFTKVKKAINNETGEIDLIYYIIGNDDELAVKPTFEILFRGKAEGSGKLRMLSGQVVGNVAENSYQLVKSEAAYTITRGTGTKPTPTTGQFDNIIVNLKLRFQGILGKPADALNRMQVKCALGDGPLGRILPHATGSFSAEAAGIWSGQISFNAPAGAGYKILCKGPKHLQKKICDGTSPTEKFPGTYSCDKGTITLKAGENNLDLSNVLLLVGDLGPAQDGVTNAYDTSYIRNNLDKSDADVVEIADLNLDGKVNAIDHSLIIAALQLRQDEQ